VELGERLIDYAQAWKLQREIHTAVLAKERPSTVLLLEHAEVFTAGKRTQPQDRPIDGSPVIEVDRGGAITWHGPGQLVAYAIVALPQPLDVVAHVRRLEQAAIDTIAEFGVIGTRVPGRSGVWRVDQGQPARKIAAIGVRVARGVTMHGLSLNVDCDLSWADRIVACGLTDAGVTSLAAELLAAGRPGSPPSLGVVAALLTTHLSEQLLPTLSSSEEPAT